MAAKASVSDKLIEKLSLFHRDKKWDDLIREVSTHLANIGESNSSFAAHLYFECGYAYLQLKNFKEAENNALKSLKKFEKLYEPHLLGLHIFISTNKSTELMVKSARFTLKYAREQVKTKDAAIHILILDPLLDIFCGTLTETPSFVLKGKFSKNEQVSKLYAELFDWASNLPVSLWPDYALELFRNSRWAPLAYLYWGGSIKYTVGHGGFATGFQLKPDAISLQNLALVSDDIWTQLGERLTIFLIQHGAFIDSLTCVHGGSAYHVAITKALLTGLLNLAKYLYKKNPKAFNEASDKKRNSLLHQVCLFIHHRRSTKSKEFTLKVIEFLEDKDVDWSRKNSSGQLAIQYLLKSDDEYEAVLRQKPFDVDMSGNPIVKSSCDKCMLSWDSALKNFTKFGTLLSTAIKLFLTEHNKSAPSPEHIQILRLVMIKLCKTFETQQAFSSGSLEDLLKVDLLVTCILYHLYRLEPPMFNRIHNLLTLISESETRANGTGDGVNSESYVTSPKLGLSAMKTLVKLYGNESLQQFEDMTKRKRYAENISLESFIRSGYYRGDDTRYELFKLLVKYGAHEGQGTLINAAIISDNFKDIIWLLNEFKEDKSQILNTVSFQTTPLHFYLDLCLCQNQDFLELFRVVLEASQQETSSKDESSPWNLDQKNSDGETLLHVAARSSSRPHQLEVVQLLCSMDVDPTIRNNSGKTPIECLQKSSRSDKVAAEIQTLLSKCTSSEEVTKSEKTFKSEMVSRYNTNISKRSPVHFDEPSTASESVELIESLVLKLSDDEFEKLKQKGKLLMEEIQTEPEVEENSELAPTHLSLFVREFGENEKKANDRSTPDILDGLEWELEVTGTVWEKLADWATSCPTFCDHVLRACERLGHGDWNGSGKRTVSIEELQLFALNVEGCDGKVVILWECAAAFSLKLSHSEGRVFTELIRIWDIVHVDDLESSTEHVVRAHERGRMCKVERHLKPLVVKSMSSKDQRLPSFYEPIEKGNIVSGSTRLVEPGSVKETEFHIMKFYALDSSMLTALLKVVESGARKRNLDFPFRVTEREDNFIKLSPDPPSPLLLIGRSGTGKTTCCLYRLFYEFQKYWNSDAIMENPLLAREIPVSDEAVPVPANDQMYYDHLHQLFLTKNSVLCFEVQKNFSELFEGNPVAQKRGYEKKSFSSLQDVTEEHYPLFTTDRSLFIMLDESLPGEKFFSAREKLLFRDPNGILSSLPIQLELDVDLDEEDELEDLPDLDISREVTFERYISEVWPTIGKKTTGYHPSLIWTEIMSFLKGSAESLVQNADLTEDQYLDIGRKRAPNFTGNRTEVFAIFKRYQKYIFDNDLYDMADVARNLYHRLPENKNDLPLHLHHIYVDETQDFTQAELNLLMRLCQNPNNMFFTGDTAQSIMRGVAFRFQDLKTLFHYAREQMLQHHIYPAVGVPQTVHQLAHNYRSHTGVLHLANSVVELLARFFPESFDRLERDEGLFDGPAPVLIESCSPDELSLLLMHSQSETGSRIEFGAHQAIIVPNEETRKTVPDILKDALILTIYEAKGLEFDDVLLYNFFSQSQAKEEWRLATSVLNEFIEKGNSQYSVDGNVLHKTRPRPLNFNSHEHKMLNSELKYLYTAITRARVNVWIFDDNKLLRKPMFEFFHALRLARLLDTDKAVFSTEDRLSGFASKSSRSDWRRRATVFFHRAQFANAVKCLEHAGQPELRDLAAALDQRMQASQAVLRTGPDRKPTKTDQKLCRDAAMELLQCGLLLEAAQCLEQARLWRPAACVYRRIGRLERAARLFVQAKGYKEASDIFSSLGKLDRAIECLEQGHLFLDALALVDRSFSSADSSQSPKLLRRSALSGAEHYQSRRLTAERDRCLDRLVLKDQITFLIRHDERDEIVNRLVTFEGHSDEHDQLLFQVGGLDEALKRARQFKNLRLEANCLIAVAENMEKQVSDDIPLVASHWRNAVKACTTVKYNQGELYCEYRLALLGNNEYDFRQCFERFHKQQSDVGCALSFNHLATSILPGLENMQHPGAGERHRLTPLLNLTFGALSLVHLLDALDPGLTQPSNAQRSVRAECLRFFGIAEISGKKVLRKSGKPPYLDIVAKSGGDYLTVLYQHFRSIANDVLYRFYVLLRKWTCGLIPCVQYMAGANCKPYCDQGAHTFYRDHKVFYDTAEIVGCLLTLTNAFLQLRLSEQRGKDLKLKHKAEEEWEGNLQFFVRLVFPPLGLHVIGMRGMNDIITYLKRWQPHHIAVYNLAIKMWNEAKNKGGNFASRLEIQMLMFLLLDWLLATLNSGVCLDNEDDFVDMLNQVERHIRGEESEIRGVLKGEIPGEETTVYFLSLKLLVWGRAEIYYNLKPVEGAMYFVNFLASAAKEKPKLSYFMYFVEHTLALLLCYYAKSTMSEVIMLESQFYLIHLCDKAQTVSTRATNRGRYISMIDSVKKDMDRRSGLNNTNIMKSLENLAIVLNTIVTDCFEPTRADYISELLKCGEVERLVLCLGTLIANIGLVFRPEIASFINLTFRLVQKKMADFTDCPKRLTQLVRGIGESDTNIDVAKSMMNHLSERGSESLLLCRWPLRRKFPITEQTNRNNLANLNKIVKLTQFYGTYTGPVVVEFSIPVKRLQELARLHPSTGATAGGLNASNVEEDVGIQQDEVWVPYSVSVQRCGVCGVDFDENEVEAVEQEEAVEVPVGVYTIHLESTKHRLNNDNFERHRKQTDLLTNKILQPTRNMKQKLDYIKEKYMATRISRAADVLEMDLEELYTEACAIEEKLDEVRKTRMWEKFRDFDHDWSPVFEDFQKRSEEFVKLMKESEKFDTEEIAEESYEDEADQFQQVKSRKRRGRRR